MSSGSAIRGSRIGSSPMRPDERSEPAPRRQVTYYCAAGHDSIIRFAAEAANPDTWDCPRCGQPAGLDPSDPPGRARTEPYKSHLAYVKERRSDADGAAILADLTALNAGVSLRTRRFTAFVLRTAAVATIVVALGFGAWKWNTRPGPQFPPVAPGVFANSVAVLPLTNATGDPRLELFADGLSDEVLHAVQRERKGLNFP